MEDQYYEGPSELFISLVGSVGTKMDQTSTCISEILKMFGYKTHIIKYSDFFKEDFFYKKNHYKINEKLPYNKTFSQMEAGNKIRTEFSEGILSEYAIMKIFDKGRSEKRNSEKTAYIFNSLKHPKESERLREVYGLAYYQIGVYTPEEQRLNALIEKKMTRSEAYKLIDKDIAEEKKEGQQTRDTFRLSDFFVRDDHDDYINTKKSLTRFFDLIFGHPNITPTMDEHMMFMAYSYSARSADLSRQVGAVISSPRGDIIGLGSNDVPRSGGGPYWPGEDDQRDYLKGYDPNQKVRDEGILDVVKEIHPDASDDERIERGRKYFKKTALMHITEFHRATHAEMSAILGCTRNGLSPVGATLYCTTFPCHNCAKHIVDSGIKKVLFVEPYPKSLAKKLHGDSIYVSLSDIGGGENKVIFDHFMGVGARRYLDLFSLQLGVGKVKHRKSEDSGEVIPFSRKNSDIRIPVPASSYKQKETYLASIFSKNKQSTP